uniref:Hypothetical secreted protein n=1 Tax=Simulium nigrimanum TaxID=683695 RepID=D1FPV1_SIMNI
MRPIGVFAIFCIIILLIAENESASVLTTSLGRAIKNATNKVSSKALNKSVVGDYVKKILQKLKPTFSKAVKTSPFRIPNQVAQNIG